MKGPFVLLVGAYARDNFGDLLYAKIIEKSLSYHKTILGGIVGRDLTGIGGDCIISARDFLRSHSGKNPCAIIHGGGETIVSSRNSAVSMILPINVFNEDLGIYQLCEEEISEKLASTKNASAYLYGVDDMNRNLKKTPLAFISIGGSSLDQYSDDPQFLLHLKSKLKSAKYISVRDKKTQQNLKKLLKIDSKLYPDLVHIIYNTHKAQINKAINNPQIRQITQKKPYILFQANQFTINNLGINEIGKILGEISSKNNQAIVLQPAGLASGHDSLDQLNELARYISVNFHNINVIVQKDRFLWNQLAIISRASCTISTSLHVRIVAASFSRPHISLPIEKVNVYAQSWQSIDDQPYNVNLEDLPEIFEKTLQTDSNTLKKTADDFADLAEAGLMQMMNTLKLNIKHNSRKIEESIPLDLFTVLSIETDRLRELVSKEIIEKRFLELQLKEIKSSKIWFLVNPLQKVTRIYNSLSGKLKQKYP